MPRYDVFRVFDNDDVLWQGSADTLEQAQILLITLMTVAPADYFILNQTTRARTLYRKPLPLAARSGG